jgi:hypothetical protein
MISRGLPINHVLYAMAISYHFPYQSGIWYSTPLPISMTMARWIFGRSLWHLLRRDVPPSIGECTMITFDSSTRTCNLQMCSQSIPAMRSPQGILSILFFETLKVAAWCAVAPKDRPNSWEGSSPWEEQLDEDDDIPEIAIELMNHELSHLIEHVSRDHNTHLPARLTHCSSLIVPKFCRKIP